MRGIKQIIVTNETSNLIHEYSQMHILFSVMSCVVSVSQLLTSSQSASILLVDSRDSSTTLLAFMLMASSSDWRSASIIVTDIWNKYLQSLEILKDSDKEARCALCNHLSLCLLWPPLLLHSSLLLSLLSSLYFWRHSAPRGSQPSQRGCGGNLKWMNEFCWFISLFWCWWIGVMGINSLPREVLT